MSNTRKTKARATKPKLVIIYRVSDPWGKGRMPRLLLAVQPADRAHSFHFSPIVLPLPANDAQLAFLNESIEKMCKNRHMKQVCFYPKNTNNKRKLKERTDLLVGM